MTRTSRAPVLLLSLLVIASRAPADDALFRERVAPLLKQRCVECHNPTKSRGGLDLSTRETLLKGGEQGPAIVPGKARDSFLVEQITGAKPSMPRKGEPLTAQQVDAIRQWIDSGATWSKEVQLIAASRPTAGDWWSLRPLHRPEVPQVKTPARARNSVDAFVLAGLEARGLSPSPETDRRALIRRVSFDLTGLPPTPEEIDAFLQDRSNAAYEKVVDRLLASPRYGERWGRHWLDVVHYGDTHGYDKDKRRDHAWPYRDWVIRSLNDDKPYPRFVQEQVAGDVLFPSDAEAIVATGFVTAGPWDFVGHVELREGTVDKLKTRLLDRDDMLASTMATFTSQTVHCARCHDHKFDPIKQEDYYRLQAVFAGVERGNRGYENVESRKKREELQARRAEKAVRVTKVQKRIDALRSPELVRLDAELGAMRKKLGALPQPPAGKPSPSNGWHSGITEAPDVVKWVQVDLGQLLPLEELRLIPARPTDFRDSPGFGFPVRFRVAVSDDPTFKKAEIVADHTGKDCPNPGNRTFRLRLEGRRSRYVRVTAERLWKRLNDYCFALAELQAVSEGKNVARGAAVTSLDSIDAGRWSRKYLVDDFDSRLSLPDRGREAWELEDQIEAAEKASRKLLDSLVDAATRQELIGVTAELARVDRELEELARPAQVYAVLSVPPRPIQLLARGNVEKPGATMEPGALACVPGLSSDFDLPSSHSEGARRAALAEWLASPNNVLTWRSIVNRVWHHHFGRGLVDTPNDFGRNGSKPTHPELLDWLAVEFRDVHRGSFKKLHRLLVTSATYRQASGHNAVAARVDGDNRYLWRMNRQRLDAESVRDTVLAVTGQLDLKMGGPGYDLFRFKDDHSPVYDHSALEKIHDPTTYRRTVYRFVVRSVPNPFLECLDGADPNINTPVRNTTLTALQALAMLNDPFMTKQAEFFAERLQKQSSEIDKHIDHGCRLAFGRRATNDEVAALTAYARKHGLANACRLLFNTNEFVFID